MSIISNCVCLLLVTGIYGIRENCFRDIFYTCKFSKILCLKNLALCGSHLVDILVQLVRVLVDQE